MPKRSTKNFHTSNNVHFIFLHRQCDAVMFYTIIYKYMHTHTLFISHYYKELIGAGIMVAVVVVVISTVGSQLLFIVRGRYFLTRRVVTCTTRFLIYTR